MSDMTDWFSELGNKQRDARVRRFFTDQHGRRWFAWADKQNQRPIGELVLDDQTGTFQSPPFVPAMQFIAWDAPDSLSFHWAYDKMADEYAGYTALYYDEASKLARHIHVDIPKPGDAVVPELISILGPPPLSPEIPLACQAGERWLLGVKGAPENQPLALIIHQGRALTSTTTLEYLREKVKKMVESQNNGVSVGGLSQVAMSSPVPDAGLSSPVTSITYNDFAAEARKAGKSMADISVAWRAHKDNLKEQGA